MTSKRQQKAGWLLPEIIETSATQAYCVVIPNTSEYRDAFVGAISNLQKWWNWEKSYTSGDTRARDAAQLFRDVMTYVRVDDCGASEMMDFRDNPLDLCEVQYSSDGGITWDTMFRKDNCSSGIIQMPIDDIISGGDTIVNNNIVYNENITNVAPEWEYTGDPIADGLRDAAMCWTLGKYVDMLCDVAKQSLDDANWVERTVDYWAGIFISPLNSLVSSIAVQTVSANSAAITAVALAIGKTWQNILNAIVGYDSSLLEDSEARLVVSCAMYAVVSGSTPQFAGWSASLDDFVPANDAEDMVSQIVDIVNHDEDSYVNWLIVTNDINDVAASLPTCTCPDRWVHTWNFETHPDAFSDGGFSTTDGLYEPGIGITDEFFAVGNFFYNGVRDLAMSEGAPNQTTDTLTCYFRIVRGYFNLNPDAVRFDVAPNPDKFWTQAHILTGDKVFSHTFDAPVTEAIMGVLTTSITDGSQDRGSCILVAYELEGTGIDPYRSQDTGEPPF